MDKIQKFLLKLRPQERAMLLKIFTDIRSMHVGSHDVKALKGYKGLFRLRKGKIRIIFSQGDKHGIIVDIAYRKDSYKRPHP